MHKLTSILVGLSSRFVCHTLRWPDKLTIGSDKSTGRLTRKNISLGYR